MKPGYGAGVLVAILVAVAAWLFGAVDFKGMIALGFLLLGIWTAVAAFALVLPEARMYYLAWGVVLALLSLTDFVRLRYALGAIVVAVVLLVIFSATRKKAAPRAPQTSA